MSNQSGGPGRLSSRSTVVSRSLIMPASRGVTACRMCMRRAGPEREAGCATASGKPLAARPGSWHHVPAAPRLDALSAVQLTAGRQPAGAARGACRWSHSSRAAPNPARALDRLDVRRDAGVPALVSRHVPGRHLTSASVQVLTFRRVFRGVGEPSARPAWVRGRG